MVMRNPTQQFILNGLRDRPIFRTDLQSRKTFELGWVGRFTEMGCSDFKGNEKSVHPEAEIPYCFGIPSHRSFILSFFLLVCDIPIDKLSIRNKGPEWN